MHSGPEGELKMAGRIRNEWLCFLDIPVIFSDICSEIDAADAELPEGRAVVEMGDLAGGRAALSPIPPKYQDEAWLLGDVFLMTRYCIFDYDRERFGLAELKEELKA